MKRLLIAGIALLTVPASLFAQKEKGKEKTTKKEVQQIIITRTGDNDEKMIVEINGDKIKINGKDPADNKDIHVNVNKIRNGNGVYRLRTGDGMNWKNLDNNFNNQISLFSEDDNRAMLGVNTGENDKGAEIQSVTTGSAAEKAGLKKDDIIVKIGDKKIENTDDVVEAIHARKPGDKVDITYLRDGKEQKTTADLGKWKGIEINAISVPRIEGMNRFRDMAPFNGQMNFDGNGIFSYSGRPKLGLSIQDTDDGEGVKVLDVDNESNAEKAGIKEGDIIVAIDDHEVKGTDDVTRTIRDEKEKYTFNFKIKRDGKTQNIEVKMPRKLKTAEL